MLLLSARSFLPHTAVGFPFFPPVTCTSVTLSGGSPSIGYCRAPLTLHYLPLVWLLPPSRNLDNGRSKHPNPFPPHGGGSCTHIGRSPPCQSSPVVGGPGMCRMYFPHAHRESWDEVFSPPRICADLGSHSEEQGLGTHATGLMLSPASGPQTHVVTLIFLGALSSPRLSSPCPTAALQSKARWPHALLFPPCSSHHLRAQLPGLLHIQPWQQVLETHLHLRWAHIFPLFSQKPGCEAWSSTVLSLGGRRRWD